MSSVCIEVIEFAHLLNRKLLIGFHLDFPCLLKCLLLDECHLKEGNDRVSFWCGSIPCCLFVARYHVCEGSEGN